MDRFSLDDILNNDPLELLSELKVKNPVVTSDDRLVVSFEEINDFYEKHKQEPQKSADMSERGLFSRLKGLRGNPKKIQALKKHDRFDLLKTGETLSIDDIFENDPLGLLGNNEEDIFTLKHVPKTTTMPSYISSRKSCEDFEEYEHLFVKCQMDLKRGKRKLIKFQNEQQIKKGYYFVLNGVLLYVLEVGDVFKKRGKVNARLKLIFENGTESDMLLRSLSAELYKNGKRVSEYDESKIEGLYERGEGDEQNGYIYILKSLSKEDTIVTKKNLYKIGFSTTAVEARIKNARQDPTYLMADVENVASYKVYDINPHKVEQLIHRIFSQSCLDIDIVDGKGDVHKPREWFIVPLAVIDEVIGLIDNGGIVNYKYDSVNEKLVFKREV